MDNKTDYSIFCERNFVPIYSKPWWMDAICEPENWDVWLYRKGNNVLAAMPYFVEVRNGFKFITKAPLTQNNGILFSKEALSGKLVSQQAFQEEVINAACEFIESGGFDVYEQQFQPSFTYWLPFFWRRYKAITRITYIIQDTGNIPQLWENISSKCRNSIRHGQKYTDLETNLDQDTFFELHCKIFEKQGLDNPFGKDLWARLYDACKRNNAGRIICRITKDHDVSSIIFLVSDERNMYLLLGGTIPGFESLQSYNALEWDAIKIASEAGKRFDFEGSVIKRISKSFREFGGAPERYYRIRKVFNPVILYQEYLEEVEQLKREGR